jgi:hypothetical protein
VKNSELPGCLAKSAAILPPVQLSAVAMVILWVLKS